MRTYKEAQELSLISEWKIETCGEGESCWCRIISVIEPIPYVLTGEEEFYDRIIGSGCIDTLTAEYIVKLHNESLKK